MKWNTVRAACGAVEGNIKECVISGSYIVIIFPYLLLSTSKTVEFVTRSFRQMPLQSCAACPRDNCYLVQVNR